MEDRVLADRSSGQANEQGALQGLAHGQVGSWVGNLGVGERWSLGAEERGPEGAARTEGTAGGIQILRVAPWGPGARAEWGWMEGEGGGRDVGGQRRRTDGRSRARAHASGPNRAVDASGPNRVVDASVTNKGLDIS